MEDKDHAMSGLIQRNMWRKTSMRATVWMVMFGLIGAPALPGWAQDVSAPVISAFTLPTGQNLYIKEDHSQPIVTIDTWVKTGSVNETHRINGVSHFLEHLLFKGTAQYKPGEIDRILEARGAEFNAATSDDFTHFYITTATPYFEEALRLHADMMLHAAVPETELTHERKVVQEEINRADDNPERQLFIALNRLMYGKHGYGLDTLGPRENIATIPRRDILDYYHYWYQPKNFNTVIVGDVNPEKVRKVVSTLFPASAFAPPKDYKAPPVGPVQPPTAPQASVLENPNISDAYFALGLLGPAQQKPEDVYALDIAMLALGSGKSSRLYRALREEQPLATRVSAGNYTQKYAGLIVIEAEAKPENREAVRKEILSQVARLKRESITQAELEKAKTQYLKDFIFENETTDGTASSIGYNVTIGNLKDYQDHVSNVKKVTLEQVRSALNRYIRPDRAVVVELLPSRMKANLKAETETDLAMVRNMEAPPATPGGASSTGAQQGETGIHAEIPVVHKTVLSNGMTFLSKPRNDSATVAVKIFVKGGQGVENIPGVAPLLSAVMMQGTRTRSAEALAQEMESQGINLSVSSDEDYIEVTGTATYEDLGELFALLKDVLNNPAFDEKEIAKKKEQIRQGIVSSRENPSAVAFENLSLALYPKHPYGNDGKRIEAHLDSITRQDLLDYYHLYFQPENMVVSVVGNFNPGIMENYLSNLYPPCANCGKSQVATPAVPNLPGSETVTEEKPRLSAAWMAQGWLAPSVREEQDYAALKVVNSLLGTGMSSRLFVDLREKQGLAYVVGSMYPTREQESRFVIYIGTEPSNVDRVKAGFDQEIRRLQEQPVPADELAEAKSKLIGAFALAHDTNISQAFYLGLYEVLGVGYQYDTDYPKRIERVTVEDVQRVARKVLAGPSVFSIIRPAPAATK